MKITSDKIVEAMGGISDRLISEASPGSGEIRGGFVRRITTTAAALVLISLAAVFAIMYTKTSGTVSPTPGNTGAEATETTAANTDDTVDAGVTEKGTTTFKVTGDFYGGAGERTVDISWERTGEKYVVTGTGWLDAAVIFPETETGSVLLRFNNNYFVCDLKTGAVNDFLSDLPAAGNGIRRYVVNDGSSVFFVACRAAEKNELYYEPIAVTAFDSRTSEILHIGSDIPDGCRISELSGVPETEGYCFAWVPGETDADEVMTLDMLFGGALPHMHELKYDSGALYYDGKSVTDFSSGDFPLPCVSYFAFRDATVVTVAHRTADGKAHITDFYAYDASGAEHDADIPYTDFGGNTFLLRVDGSNYASCHIYDLTVSYFLDDWVEAVGEHWANGGDGEYSPFVTFTDFDGTAYMSVESDLGVYDGVKHSIHCGQWIYDSEAGEINGSQEYEHMSWFMDQFSFVTPKGVWVIWLNSSTGVQAAVTPEGLVYKEDNITLEHSDHNTLIVNGEEYVDLSPFLWG